MRMREVCRVVLWISVLFEHCVFRECSVTATSFTWKHLWASVVLFPWSSITTATVHGKCNIQNPQDTWLVRDLRTLLFAAVLVSFVRAFGMWICSMLQLALLESPRELVGRG